MQILSIIFASTFAVSNTASSVSPKHGSSRVIDIMIREDLPLKSRTSTLSSRENADVVEWLSSHRSKHGSSKHSSRDTRPANRRSSNSHSESGSIRIKKSDIYDLIEMLLKNRPAACIDGSCETVAQAIAPQSPFSDQPTQSPYGYIQSGQYAQYYPATPQMSACQQCSSYGIGCSNCPAATPPTPSRSVVNNYYRSVSSSPKLKTRSTQTDGSMNKVMYGRARDINAQPSSPVSPVAYEKSTDKVIHTKAREINGDKSCTNGMCERNI